MSGYGCRIKHRRDTGRNNDQRTDQQHEKMKRVDPRKSCNKKFAEWTAMNAVCEIFMIDMINNKAAHYKKQVDHQVAFPYEHRIAGVHKPAN